MVVFASKPPTETQFPGRTSSTAVTTIHFRVWCIGVVIVVVVGSIMVVGSTGIGQGPGFGRDIAQIRCEFVFLLFLSMNSFLLFPAIIVIIVVIIIIIIGGLIFVNGRHDLSFAIHYIGQGIPIASKGGGFASDQETDILHERIDGRILTPGNETIVAGFFGMRIVGEIETPGSGRLFVATLHKSVKGWRFGIFVAESGLYMSLIGERQIQFGELSDHIVSIHGGDTVGGIESGMSGTKGRVGAMTLVVGIAVEIDHEGGLAVLVEHGGE